MPKRAIGLSLTGLFLAGAAYAQDLKLADILPATPGARACFARSTMQGICANIRSSALPASPSSCGSSASTTRANG
jgi:hypothetical protein